MQGPVNGESEPPSVVASSTVVQSVQQESFQVGGLMDGKQNFITEVSLQFFQHQGNCFSLVHRALQTELLDKKNFPLHAKIGQAKFSPQPVTLLGC